MSRTLPALLLLLAPLPCRADDWPQWRGRDRDGLAHGAKLPKTWPDDPPKPLWKYKVGEGQSSPVVAGGRVFVMGRLPDGTETCWCLDADTGKLRWKHGYEVKYKPADASAGTGPKSTPTVDGDRVYMLGVAGMFHCFAVSDGEVLWKHDFLKEFWGVARDKDGDDAYSTCCGAAASPLVDGKRVLLPVGGKKAGAVTAFDRESGKIVWKSPLTDRSSYGSGLIAELDGKKQLVGFTGLKMCGLSLEDGSLLWGEPFKALFEQTIQTPVLWKGRVILGGEDRETFALEPSYKDGKWTTKTLWKNERLRSYLTSPIAVKDHLYGLSKRGEVVCVDLESGKTAWASAASFGGFGSVTAAGNVLLVLTRSGELHVIEASPKKFTRLVRWQLSSNSPVWSNLALVGGRLYIKDKTDVICFDLSGK